MRGFSSPEGRSLGSTEQNNHGGAGLARVRVRTAPRFVPFMAAGALCGGALASVIALIPDRDYSAGSVFGFFLVALGAVGMLAGAAVALVVDRVSLRRAQSTWVEPVVDGEHEQE